MHLLSICIHAATAVKGTSRHTSEGCEGSMRMRGGMRPACTACAAFTISEPCACRKTSRRSTTGTIPESMAALRKEPALTGGSWSASPAAACAALTPGTSGCSCCLHSHWRPQGGHVVEGASYILDNFLAEKVLACAVDAVQTSGYRFEVVHLGP